MKIIYFTLLLVTCFFSCKEKAIEDNIPIIYPRDNMACLLDSFIHEENTSNKFNEIYIDKRTTRKYDIIIYSGEFSLSESVKPLVRVNRSGVIFDLYSGLEHYFSNTQDMLEFEDTPRKEGPPNGMYRVIEDKNGEFRIKKDMWVIPFYSLIGTGVKFTPPSSIFDNE